MAKAPKSFGIVAKGYANLWNKAELTKKAEAFKVADRILKVYSRYTPITQVTGVPEWVIGILHYREANLNFGSYLGNGQTLSRRTTIVPKGRGPFQGENAFIRGAIDALEYEGFDKIKDWSAARFLYESERFNGFGYYMRGINSPYVWGGTSNQQRGKFVRDGVFNPNVMDTQLGSAAILKALCERSMDINKAINSGKTAAEIAKETKDMTSNTPPVMVDVKPWYAKKTVWLAAIAVGAQLVNFLTKGKLNIDPGWQDTIAEWITIAAGSGAIGTAVTSSTVTPTGADIARKA